MPFALLLPLLPLLWAVGLIYYVIAFRKQALLPPKSGEQPYDLVVQAAARDEITLRALNAKRLPADLAHPGTLGLQWDGGYRQVGAVVRSIEHAVARRLDSGGERPALGTPVRLDSFAFTRNPMSRGIPFDDIVIAGPLGACPAWRIEGAGSTWAILVHGKGASRREFLRMLPAFHAAALPALVVTYRNDEGAPAAPDGRYGYGATEWRDVEAAVEYALANGAERVLLGGCSMGGAICLALLRSSRHRSRVAALVLDSPLLDFAATVAHGSRLARTPRLIGGPGRLLAGRLLGLDWQALDYLRGAATNVTVPVLLFHGTADGRVPVATSDQLAAMLPDLSDYKRLDGVDHVRSWNADPETYERAVSDFLEQLGIVTG